MLMAQFYFADKVISLFAEQFNKNKREKQNV